MLCIRRIHIKIVYVSSYRLYIQTPEKYATDMRHVNVVNLENSSNGLRGIKRVLTRVHAALLFPARIFHVFAVGRTFSAGVSPSFYLRTASEVHFVISKYYTFRCCESDSSQAICYERSIIEKMQIGRPEHASRRLHVES